MHLNEFADPEDYAPPATDAEDFPQQRLIVWSDPSLVDLVPPALHSRKQPSIKPTRFSSALSVGSHIGGAQLPSRRGASQ
jgi:hypothetical protein